MKNPFLLLSLMAALAAGPALSQETTQNAGESAQDTASDGTTNIGGALDLGESVPNQQQPGAPETYIKETFTDWALQCIKVDAENEVCQMYQLLKESGGASVAEVSLFKLENGGRAIAGGTFVVPLETLLSAKLTIQVDNGQPRRYDYSFCSQVGCYARVGFTAEDISQFKAGAKAKVTLVPALAPDQKVEVEMSLSGFTAAFDSVSTLQQ